MHYPQISVGIIPQLQVIFAALAADPEYFDRKECPYPDSVKDFFKKYGTPVASTDVGVSIFDEEGDKWEIIERQIGALIRDLNQFAATLKTNDASERLQYFKTKAGLIEKLISLRERIYSLKEMSDFQSIIMAFMDELCTKDQISQLINRLGSTLKAG